MGGGSSPCVVPPSSLHPVATSASPPFFPARHAITAPLPPQGPRPACITITPSAAVHARPPSVLHEQFAMPLDFIRGFLLNDLRRPSRAAPLFSPCGSTPSCRAAASQALSSAPAPSPTALSTPPHTCACAFQHRELRVQARANRSTTRRRSRIRTRTPACRRPARPPLLAQGPCTHRPCAAHAAISPLLTHAAPLPRAPRPCAARAHLLRTWACHCLGRANTWPAWGPLARS
jgi:hypothetical protein